MELEQDDSAGQVGVSVPGEVADEPEALTPEAFSGGWAFPPYRYQEFAEPPESCGLDESVEFPGTAEAFRLVCAGEEPGIVVKPSQDPTEHSRTAGATARDGTSRAEWVERVSLAFDADHVSAIAGSEGRAGRPSFPSHVGPELVLPGNGVVGSSSVMAPYEEHCFGNDSTPFNASVPARHREDSLGLETEEAERSHDLGAGWATANHCAQCTAAPAHERRFSRQSIRHRLPRWPH